MLVYYYFKLEIMSDIYALFSMIQNYGSRAFDSKVSKHFDESLTSVKINLMRKY
jgi:hypothetical protein